VNWFKRAISHYLHVLFEKKKQLLKKFKTQKHHVHQQADKQESERERVPTILVSNSNINRTIKKPFPLNFFSTKRPVLTVTAQQQEEVGGTRAKVQHVRCV
jgi:enoyl reductase-like protein